MTIEMKYSSALTGASFMFREFKKVTSLKNEGLSKAEIRSKVIDENIFEYEKTTSIKRAIPYIIKRTDALDAWLSRYVLEEPVETAKCINLYGIMKTDRLFFEFMNEVVREKLEASDYTLEKKEINIFFSHKAEQDEFLASWSDSTVQRLKQAYRKVLVEMGILKNIRSDELNRIIIDEQIKDHLNRIGDVRYVRAMGE